MSLSRKIKLETKIKSIESISDTSVYSMLSEVKRDLTKLYPSFENHTLSYVLRIVESGEYKIEDEDGVTTIVDLSEATRAINTYRRYSEGGCQSCTSQIRLTVDAQDASSFWYCKVHEPNIDELKKEIGYGIGPSPRIKIYNRSPCESWTPRFSPKIEELVNMENLVNS